MKILEMNSYKQNLNWVEDRLKFQQLLNINGVGFSFNKKVLNKSRMMRLFVIETEVKKIPGFLEVLDNDKKFNLL